MNYIYNNLRKVIQDKIARILICKKSNKFITKYASDKKVYQAI